MLGGMPMTLRQRNRMAAMQAIQDTAMELFDQHGYQQVTVDDIVREAGVSASTFYRYFGTKEGLFTADPFAAVGADSFQEIVDLDDPATTMERLAATAGTGGPWRGMRYVIEEPVVRAAVYASMDALVDRLTPLLTARGHTPNQARVLARTYLFAVYFGALEEWHRDGRTRPIGDYAREAMAALRSAAGW
ncbi:TetR family transcriptional regulator [Kribbella orskensis]|uniref:TetR family transcriptional regulator n=2 Tax=Kribbellaceae TaxID=2726069 RepID=A0ABY2BCP6_9ACTN|nr:TetR family transcriptional regulator [Kribbella sp. VKM Ac-2500]TCO16641.1 TetR family transcriptional regulator [Kribbella orskensis]